MSAESRLAAVEKAINSADDAHEPTRYCREGVCAMCTVIEAINEALVSTATPASEVSDD